jgi:hypothetical protein
MSDPNTPIADAWLQPNLHRLSSKDLDSFHKIDDWIKGGCRSSSLKRQWEIYTSTPRCLLYERWAGQGGFDHGLASMLITPRRNLTALFSAQTMFNHTEVNAIGVSLPETTPDTTQGKTILALEGDKLPREYRVFTQRPASIMAKPVCMPSWAAFPAHGIHDGWDSIQAGDFGVATSVSQWIAQVALVKLDECLAPLLCEIPFWIEQLSALRNGLANLESSIADAMVARFCLALNPVVAQGCLSIRGAVYPAEYNWVVGGSTARLWQRRMEALQVVPAICTSAVHQAIPVQVSRSSANRSRVLHALVEWSESSLSDSAVTIAQVVDNGLPLFANLAQSFEVKPATIRSLRGIPPQYAPVLVRPYLGWQQLLQTLDAVAPERLPRSADDWLAFDILYREAIHPYEALMKLHKTVAKYYMEISARPWIARKARNWATALEKWRDSFRLVQDLSRAEEFVIDIERYVNYLNFSQSQRYALYKRLANCNPALWQELIESYERICTSGNRVKLQRTSKNSGLPANNELYFKEELMGRLFAGLPVRRLLSLKELQEEGGLMRHCIASHYSSLYSSRNMAFAIGIDNTPDRSTLKVVYSANRDGSWRVIMLDHRAWQNISPSQKCNEAAKELTQLLSSEIFRSYLNRWDVYRSEFAKILSIKQLQRKLDDTQLEQGAARAERVLVGCGIL